MKLPRESPEDPKMPIDNRVLEDAAKILRLSASQLLRLSKTTACTDEHEAAILSRVKANLAAVEARLQ